MPQIEKDGVRAEMRRYTLSPRMHIEMVKNKRGAVLVTSGIINVADFSKERILLVSHAGRVEVLGRELGLSVLMKGTVELFGKIEGVNFSYVKN